MIGTEIAPERSLTADEAKHAEELGGRLFNAFLGTLDLFSVYLGDRLGLYRALATGGPATSSELAQRAGIAPRYAREWLEQQAVTGLITVDDATAEVDERRYALPSGHVAALTDRDSPYSITPIAQFLPALGKVAPQLLQAYRSGGGVSWSEYGDDVWQGQGDFNRPLFRHQLTQEILPNIADVHAKLTSGAKVADIACGVGWSSVAIARAYPKSTVDGFDTDERAIAAAKQIAKDEGVGERVRFHIKDAASIGGQYDIVTIFEALHDMSRPVEVLRAARDILAEDGVVLVMDENAAETFSAPGTDSERLFYGASIVVCLPNGLAEQPSAGTGAVMRPATLRRYAVAAGFREAEALSIEHPFFRFYLLRK
jgi:2-polyprenyl-3-methyl-5-hydroxy-6-metoxy-1,4-benzoquinol methylase